MIVSGRFLPNDPLEAYHSKWWDARDRAFQAKHLTRFDRRDRSSWRGYYRGCHADWTWSMARYGLGRVRIVKTRRQ